jgi:hypothetical protein
MTATDFKCLNFLSRNSKKRKSQNDIAYYKEEKDRLLLVMLFKKFKQ